FEEGSLEHAERRARALEQRRGSRLQVPTGTARPPWLRLGKTGRPGAALLWKNTVFLQRSLGLRLLPMLILMLVSFGMFGLASAKGAGHSALAVVGFSCAAGYGLLLALG